MAQNVTQIFRVSLKGEPSIYRDIEIEASKSLYQLAKVINLAFDFDFDHCFGFYSGLTETSMRRKQPIYELFADMGEADPGVLSVKKTKVAQAFPALGHTMLFLFDYGDDWHFRVKLKATGTKARNVPYPRVVESRGAAPEQYPVIEDDDRPRVGINLATGEKIYFGKK
jgi:hypothetical protein